MLPLVCPTDNELAEYSLGNLSTERLEQVANHVDGCTSCSGRLDGMARQTDPLADAVRRAGQVSAFAAEATPPPKALGEYRLEDVLGEGGMGTVYRATHTRLGRPVALKLLTARRRLDPDAAARFEREMLAIGALRHPNIVQAMDAREIDGVPFLAMELLDGRDLARIVAEHGPLSVPDACEVTRQAALGLQHAHEHGLVHRDVKPSNLMLTPDGTVKLLDLGLARTAESVDTPDPAGATVVRLGDLTATDLRVGTEKYMAPEQSTAPENVDARADVYALGRTLCFLLTRSPDLPTGGAVPSGLVRLLQRLQTDRPEDRIASAELVAKALRPWSRDHDLNVLVGGPRRRRFRVRWVLVPLIALGVLAAGTTLAVNKLNHTQAVEEVRHVPPDPPPPGTIPMTVEEARDLQRRHAAFLRTESQITDGQGQKLVLVPPGTIVMSRTTQVPITRPYWLGATEVTVGQYRRFVEATGYKTEVEKNGTGVLSRRIEPKKKNVGSTSVRKDKSFAWHNPGYAGVTDEHPVSQLAFDDAFKYCEWLTQVEGRTYRLPTRSESEWAARAGRKEDFPGDWVDGNFAAATGKSAWSFVNGADFPQPVGRLQPNPWGLYDMLGNVDEMTSDWWGEFPSGTFPNYSGPPAGEFRTTYGGSIIILPGFNHAGPKVPGLGSSAGGFRVLREP